MYIFDFDGTLVDTKSAVKAAYTEAGVKKSDEEWEHVWGLPWQDWLQGEEGEKIHKKKNQVLAKHLHKVRPLRLMPIALSIKAPVVTGASKEAVAQVLLRLALIKPEIAALKVVLVGVNPLQKAEYLDWASEENNMDLLYVDDMQRVRDLMNGMPGEKRWKAISPDECLESLRLYSQLGKIEDSKA